MTMIGKIDTQLARREHICWWCGDVIEKKTTYAKWLWKESGLLITVKCHPECRKAWSTLPPDSEVSSGERERGCTCESGHCQC